MSSIKLKHSGGNSVSLNPPTSAPTSSDVAFKLPNADGSANQLLKTDGSGNLGWATDSGKILQYKVSKKTNTTSTTSQSYAEISNDFRITLTPTASDSTIIVTAYLNVANSNNANTFRLRRNTASDFSGTSTEVIQPSSFSANEDGVASVYETGSHIFTLPVIGWETSGNTTARTYSVFWRVGGGTMYLNRLYNSDSYHSVSTMTVIEVAA